MDRSPRGETGPTGVALLLWFVAVVEASLAGLALIAPGLFASPTYAALASQLVPFAALCLGAAAAAVAASDPRPPPLARSALAGVAAIPPVILALVFLAAASAMGTAAWGTMAAAIGLFGVPWTGGRVPRWRPLPTFAGVVLLLHGLNMLANPASYTTASYGAFAGQLWLLAPLFVGAGAGLLVSERRAARRTALGFAALAILALDALVVAYLGSGLWTGVTLYGAAAIFLATTVPERPALRHVPLVLLLHSGVLALYDVGANVLALAGSLEQHPDWGELWASLGLALVIGAWLARSYREVARGHDPSRALAALAVGAGAATLLGRGGSSLDTIVAAFSGRESDLAAGVLAASLGAALLLERRWPVAALVSVGTLGAALSLEEIVGRLVSLGGAPPPVGAGTIDPYDALALLGASLAIGLLGFFRSLEGPIRERILAAISAVVVLALAHSVSASVALEDLVGVAGGSPEARALAAGALATRGVLLVLLVGSAAVSAVVIAATITRPLDQVVAAIRRYAAGDRTARGAVTRSDEIGTVARAIDALTGSLELAELEQRRLHAVVRDDQQRLRAIVDTALDAFVTMDAEGRVVDWNRNAEATFGWSRAEVAGQRVQDTIVPSPARDSHGRGLAGHPGAPKGLLVGKRQRMTALHRDGHVFPIEIAVTALGEGDARIYSAFLRDVTELEQHEAELKRLALYDALTGLPNRTLLEDRWALALAAARRDGTLVAVAALDLDHFKTVNDSLGHPAGDALLREVAERLRAATRATDTAARLGGDEFAVVLGGLARESEATAAARALLSALKPAIVVEGQPVYLGASVGLALVPEDRPFFEETMRRADVALDEAKRRGGGDVSLYDAAADANRPEAIALVADLHEAIERSELSLAYQPIVESDSGRCQRFEALARWEHPRRGSIAPAVFVELAERSGLIRALGLQVLERALGDLARWRAEGLELSLSVNVSMLQLGDGAFVDTALATLRRLDLPPDRLTVEVTESAIMRKAGRVLEDLMRLRAAGAHVSVDDFGTGYSSLAYLRSLPVDEIKLDKSLLRGAAEHADGVAIVRAAAALARAMDLCFVAEGVEDQATWDFLRTLGGACVQGFHVSRPMPPDAVPAWSAAWNRRWARRDSNPHALSSTGP